MIPQPTHGRFRWTLIAFAACGLLISALVVWQLYETKPARWCAVALNASPEANTGCYSLLLRLLDIKDHAVMGLLAILGLTVLSVVVVALGVNIRGSGPGGLNVDIGADKTRVETEGGSVEVPTPPSKE